MTIEWNESMSTGVPEIDKEHKEWLRRFNKFDEAVINRLGMEAVQEALAFFEQYTETHFPHEEEISRHRSAQMVQKNREQHKEFRGKIQEIRGWIEQEGVSMVEVMSLKMEMEDWLTNHIRKVDVQLFTADKG
jgi:hemerythrin